jgi:hypothetical protein
MMLPSFQMTPVLQLVCLSLVLLLLQPGDSRSAHRQLLAPRHLILPGESTTPHDVDDDLLIIHSNNNDPGPGATDIRIIRV